MHVRSLNRFFLIFAFFPLFADAGDETWSLSSHYGKVRAIFGQARLVPDATLKLELKQANAEHIGTKPFLINDQVYGWILIRKPSKQKSFGKGLCGAGTEDYIALVRIDRSALIYVDKTLAQSCLGSLQIDGLDEGEIALSELLVQNNELTYLSKRMDAGTAYRTAIKLVPTPSQIIRLEAVNN